MLSPQEFLNQYLGWGKDVNGAAGIQCVDLAKEHFRLVGVPNYAGPIGGDGYADNIWYNRERWATWYDFIPAGQFQDGDMVVFPHQSRGGWTHPYSHVCFWYSGQEFGTNQGVAQATLKSTDWSDALGALRYKGWNTKATIPDLASDVEINGHSYSLYKQAKGQAVVVLSAGLNQLASLRNLDADVYVCAKITGANYFQMRTDQTDPYGTTYGDLSSPLNDAYQNLPNQNSTLYYDIESGVYGDCTGVEVDRSHNVFSPAVVYPQYGNFQYARMVGMDHVNVVSRYSFVIRMPDGTYALGIANQDLTPKQIAEDFRSAYYFESIAFLDGGGSAQMARWSNHRMEYVRETGRECPSAVAIVSTKPYETDEPIIVPVPEPAPIEPEPEPTPADPEPLPEVPEIIIDDGEEEKMDQKVTIVEQIAKLIDVKSIITFMLIGTLCYLAINGRTLDQQFMTIVTAVVTFYFSYQVKKNSEEKK